MRSHFLEEGLSSSQEALLVPLPPRHSFSSSLYSMATTGGPDLERGDVALKVPEHPFSAPSPSPNTTQSPKSPPHQSRDQVVKRKPHPSQPKTHRRQSQHQHPNRTNDPTAIPPKLLKLRTIIGISTPSALLPPTPSSKNPFTSRPAPNLGIYTRIVREEISAKRQFYIAASIINTCYFGQICIAAALTALGASASSNIAITVLGAANTVLAGVLTYLKGQGLPNRLRMYWTSLRKCREFIEEKEREIAAEGYGWDEKDDPDEEGIDVDAVIEVIVGMYHDVRQTAEGEFSCLFRPLFFVNPFRVVVPLCLKCLPKIAAIVDVFDKKKIGLTSCDNTDNTPDTYLPMKGSAATTAPAAKKATKQTIPYPNDDDISEAAAAAADDNDNDDADNPAPNGQAIDPKSATASASKAMSSKEGNPVSPTAPTPASGNVESAPK